MSSKKGVLNNSQNLQENSYVEVPFLINDDDGRYNDGLKPATLLKKRLAHLSFCAFSRNF